MIFVSTNPAGRGLARSFAGGRGRHWGAVLGVALWMAGVAGAHDPFEITTNAQFSDGALSLGVTMARSTALAVAAGGRESPTFDPAQFAAHRADLLACAPQLFVVTAAGRPLAITSIDVALSVENDVEFHLNYPRPAAGTLRFEATHVVKLGYGFGNVLTVQGAGGRGAPPAQKLLTGQDAVLEMAVAPGAPAVVRVPITSPEPAQPFRFGLAAIAAAMIAVVAWWASRRQRVTKPI